MNRMSPVLRVVAGGLLVFAGLACDSASAGKNDRGQDSLVSTATPAPTQAPPPRQAGPLPSPPVGPALDPATGAPKPSLSGPLPTATPFLQPGGTRLVPAPIEKAELVVMESHPPIYALRVVAGLPHGCARPATTDVTLSGNTVRVQVLNTEPLGRVVCTQIYGTYEVMVDLGKGFQSRVQYSVDVNGTIVTFTAE